MGEPELTPMQVIELTASAIKKVHLRGRRGVEMVTHDEIVAVIGTLLDMGAGALAGLEEALAEDRDAARYRWLRMRNPDSIEAGGVFAGLTPDNVVLSGEDLDQAIDAAMAEVDVATAATSPILNEGEQR
ncbi:MULTISPECIES: hypothetical protein [unclassified Marinovum]|uniref:hypothetical protein n=1 Tax=unclassified Marinovum TaxID=2647166 RepID=UPI003EDC2234